MTEEAIRQRRAYQRRYRALNRKKISEYNKKYFEENKERLKEVRQKWREENRDKVNEYHREWRKENKDKVKKYNQNFWNKKAIEFSEWEKSKQNDERNSWKDIERTLLQNKPLQSLSYLWRFYWTMDCQKGQESNSDCERDCGKGDSNNMNRPTRKQMKEIKKMGFNSVEELQEALKKEIANQRKQLRNQENDKFLSDNEEEDFNFDFLEDFELDLPDLDFDFDFLDEEWREDSKW